MRRLDATIRWPGASGVLPSLPNERGGARLKENSELPFIGLDRSIRETISEIDQHGDGVALVVDDGKRLIATVTDGDIRRAILAGIELDLPVSSLIDHREARDREDVARHGRVAL